MNLFTNPSVHELSELLSQCDATTPSHHLVVDYDGEVLIDPELKQPEIKLDKFKLHVHLKASGKELLNRSSNWMKNLLNNLVDSWENNTKLSDIIIS